MLQPLTARGGALKRNVSCFLGFMWKKYLFIPQPFYQYIKEQLFFDIKYKKMIEKINICAKIIKGGTTNSYQPRSDGWVSLVELYEVLNYIKDHPNIISISTYGGQGGTYRAISSVDDIDIARECMAAKLNNPNYLRNINNYH